MTPTQRHYLIYHGIFLHLPFTLLVIINHDMFILCISRGPASGHLVPYLYTSLFFRQSDRPGPASEFVQCGSPHSVVFIPFMLLRVVLRTDDRASIESSLSHDDR